MQKNNYTNSSILLFPWIMRLESRVYSFYKIKQNVLERQILEKLLGFKFWLSLCSSWVWENVYILWVSHFSSFANDNDSKNLMGLVWELNELVDIKCLKWCLVFGKKKIKKVLLLFYYYHNIAGLETNITIMKGYPEKVIFETKI